jgi:flagellar motor switch protein FliG
LDLLAVAPHPQWFALALAFLNAYDNAPVLAQLKKELALPNRHGFGFGGASEQVLQILRR